jgi:peptidoglycan hydrolase CwlO-like protein
MKFWSENGRPADPSYRDLTPPLARRPNLVVSAAAVAATTEAATTAEAAAAKAAAAEAVAAAKAAEAAEAWVASTEAAQATRASGTLVATAEPAEAVAGTVIGRPWQSRRTDSRTWRDGRWSLWSRYGWD